MFLNRHRPIRAGVIFGNPQKRCAGHGICKLTSTESLAACSCFSAIAFISFFPETSTASFFFPKALDVSGLLSIYFKGDHFLVEEDVSFKLEDLGSVGGTISIERGRYSFEKKEDGVYLLLSYRQDYQDSYSAGRNKPNLSVER